MSETDLRTKKHVESEKSGATAQLATFLATLRYEDLPRAVVDRAEDLFLDWVASALAGRGAGPVTMLEHMATMMGPASGPSELLVSRRRSSPLFAALVNAASSHVVEQSSLIVSGRWISSLMCVTCCREVDVCGDTLNAAARDETEEMEK